jgi:prolyl-tRNA synthetase
VVQPTSEEVVTDILRQEVKSYKQLPEKPLPNSDQIP